MLLDFAASFNRPRAGLGRDVDPAPARAANRRGASKAGAPALVGPRRYVAARGWTAGWRGAAQIA